MAYGARFRTPTQEIVIDGQRKHPFLYEEDSIIAPQGRSFPVLSFTPTNNYIMPLVHPIDGYVAVRGLERTGGQYTGVNVICLTGESQMQLDYRMFNVNGASGVTLPGDYGARFYGPNGNLIFSSLQPTVRVHAFGEVTITSNNTTPTVPFDPIEEKPWFFVGNPGLFDYFVTVNQANIFFPGCGPARKDQQGRYDGFQVVAVPFQLGPPTFNATGTTPLPWTVPYVVFV